jgi:fructokinase
MKHRIGIDFGGTKIEIVALAPDGAIALRRRVPNPRTYETSIGTVVDLVAGVEAELGQQCTVGIGIPGAISPATGLVKNANSVWLNNRPLDRDFAAALNRPVRVENDANCFALSEAADGAGAGKRVVFGVILGTGCGGGIVVDGAVLPGLHRVSGEWGHTPLPWPKPDELPAKPCFCGHAGCLERYIAGPSLAEACDGPGHADASGLESRAAAGDARAQAALQRHADQVARGLAVVVNILDPDVIVMGGGVSGMAHLYMVVPELLARYAIAADACTPIVRNMHGDSSGVRGAAWLWPSDRACDSPEARPFN